MSMELPDRPATLGRSRPKPAPMEDIDPIDTRGGVAAVPAAAPAPAPAAETAPAAVAFAPSNSPAPVIRRAPRPVREREIVVQLNSKISLDARDALDRISAQDGRTLRSGVETGIYLLDYLASAEDPSLEALITIYNDSL